MSGAVTPTDRQIKAWAAEAIQTVSDWMAGTGDDGRDLDRDMAAVVMKIVTSARPPAEALQPSVLPWLIACFGETVAHDREERADRLVEELFELLQSGGYDPNRIIALRDYVWSRPVGEPAQEVGGTMLTLAAYCIAHGLDMHAAGDAELARVWGKVDVIRAKQAAKPKGSALPQAWNAAAQANLAYAAPPARPLGEWLEDMGFVVWWKFPVEEPAWIGSPLCSDWPGYHTHFTPHPCVPAASDAAQQDGRADG